MDDNGCWEVDTAWVSDTSAMSVQLTVSDITCNGNADGSVTANVTNGTAPLEYYWSTGDMTSSISSLGTGTFTVTVLDDSLCQEIQMATITEPLVLVVTITTAYDTSAGTGSATTTVSGGTAPYMYKWSDGSTATGLTGVAAANYSLTVTDANGCEVTGSGMVSIEDIEVGLSTKVYPNPTAGSLTLEIGLSKAQELEIGIYNILGERIAVIENGKSYGGIYLADLSNYDDGIYFIRIKTANGVSVSKVTLSR